jgi:hypothetical protein
MRAYNLLYILLCLGLLASCKSESANTSSTETTSTDPEHEQVPTTHGNEKEMQGTDYTFLTHQMFHIRAAIVTGRDPNDNPYKGHWIDLLPNGTYHYGKQQTELYTGTWSYNHDAGILALNPNVDSEKRSEWKVMHNEQMVILVGTQTYGNNGTQMQLIRHADKPE